MQGGVETAKCLRLLGPLRQFHFGVNRRRSQLHRRAICTTILRFFVGLCKAGPSECAPLNRRVACGVVSLAFPCHPLLAAGPGVHTR